MSDTPVTDGFPTALVEKEIKLAINGPGMRLHTGRVTLDASHVQRIISKSRQLERELSTLRVAHEQLREDAKAMCRIAADWHYDDRGIGVDEDLQAVMETIDTPDYFDGEQEIMRRIFNLPTAPGKE